MRASASASASELVSVLVLTAGLACADDPDDGALTTPTSTSTSTSTSTTTSTGSTSTGAASSSTAGSTTDGTTTTGDGTTDADPTTGTATTSDTTGDTDTTDTDTTGDLEPDHEVLLDLPGEVFVPTPEMMDLHLDFGTDGVAYSRLDLAVDLTVGGWQPEIPDDGDPDRTEHILFGLFRANQAQSYQRYLMGTAAVIFAAKKGPHFRMFGREAIAMGYMSYTSWSGGYAWQEGDALRLECSLDGLLHTQRCALLKDGEVVAERAGEVPYLDPAAHLASGFYLELGAAPADEIETSPVGWVFSDLRIVGTKL